MPSARAELKAASRRPQLIRHITRRRRLCRGHENQEKSSPLSLSFSSLRIKHTQESSFFAVTVQKVCIRDEAEISGPISFRTKYFAAKSTFTKEFSCNIPSFYIFASIRFCDYISWFLHYHLWFVQLAYASPSTTPILLRSTTIAYSDLLAMFFGAWAFLASAERASYSLSQGNVCKVGLDDFFCRLEKGKSSSHAQKLTELCTFRLICSQTTCVLYLKSNI